MLQDGFFNVIVIGGGTCGLAVAARLCEDCAGSIYTQDEQQRFRWLGQRGNKMNLINTSGLSRKRNQHSDPDKVYKPRRKFHPLEILVLDALLDQFIGEWDNQFHACQIPSLRSPMFCHPDPVNIESLVCFAHSQNRELLTDLMEIENVVGKEYSKHQLKTLAKNNKLKGQMKTCSVPLNSVHHDKPGIIDINMRDWKVNYRPSTLYFTIFTRVLSTGMGYNSVFKKMKL